MLSDQQYLLCTEGSSSEGDCRGRDAPSCSRECAVPAEGPEEGLAPAGVDRPLTMDPRVLREAAPSTPPAPAAEGPVERAAGAAAACASSAAVCCCVSQMASWRAATARLV